jgi:hypothetical protein
MFCPPWKIALTFVAKHMDDVAFEILGGSTYRMHRFRSAASPVEGMTSDILVRARPKRSSLGFFFLITHKDQNRGDRI